MNPYYQKSGITLYNGDCREVMADLPDNSCGLTVTSPPYNMRTRIRNGEEASELKAIGWRQVDYLRHMNFMLETAIQVGGMFAGTPVLTLDKSEARI